MDATNVWTSTVREDDPFVGEPAREALRALIDHAKDRRVDELALPLANRALAVTRGADFPVARDALDALLRRLRSAREARFVVRSRGGGAYQVARRGRGSRGYEVWLAHVESMEGSCTCPDFAKASLGLCKHLFAVLASKHAHRASKARGLRWDPVRPLTGPGDWLDRIWLDPTANVPARVARLFQKAPARRPIEALRDPVARRYAVALLLGACKQSPTLAEPAIGPLLEREHAWLRRRADDAIDRRLLDRALGTLKLRLFPYQREGVERFLASGHLLLADDMGLGKTAQAIASCHALFATGKIRRALVVVPASLKAQWLREWRAFSDLEIAMVDGGPETRTSIYRAARTGVLLVNYEQLLRDLPQVLELAPELVILDEAQRIKNWQTKTAETVKQLAPRWKLVLTGTPMENRLDELASIMEWVDEPALEPRWRLASWHAIRVDGTREIVGARNLDTLRCRLAPHMLRRVRRDVLAQLPPRRDAVVSVPLTEHQQAAHRDLDRPIAALVGTAAKRPLLQAEFLRLMQLLTRQRMICNALALTEFDDVWPGLERSRRRSESLLDSLGSPKLLELRERLVDLVVTQERKVVVFSQWRRMLQLAAWSCGDLLANAGVRAVFFSGQESQRRRTQNLVDFHDDPATRVLFATDAGGVGLNLQRAASACINLELPWNPAVLEQRIGRIYRLGQTQPVDVYNFVATGGIEARIAGIVGGKRALFTGLFDGTSDEVPFDSAGSFLAQVREVVEMPATSSPETDSDDDELEPDDPIDAVSEIAPHGVASPATTGFTLDVADLAATLSQVAVRQLAGGRLSVELPRSAATALGSLLRALAAAVET
ncbi:MAG: DEAD/DEAH box helicase, partial [Kofleriaceae bacterium]